jgi:hypothetical protein
MAALQTTVCLAVRLDHTTQAYATVSAIAATPLLPLCYLVLLPLC